MNRPQWSRILVFGVLAGIVWTLLSAAMLALIGNEFLSALPERSGRVQGFLLGANIAAGVWATWLYSTVRSQYGRGFKSVVIATCGWWVIQSLQSSKWAALEGVPMHAAWAPGLGTLAAMFLATALAAWCYENYQRTASPPAAPASNGHAA